MPDGDRGICICWIVHHVGKVGDFRALRMEWINPTFVGQSYTLLYAPSSNPPAPLPQPQGLCLPTKYTWEILASLRSGSHISGRCTTLSLAFPTRGKLLTHFPESFWTDVISALFSRHLKMETFMGRVPAPWRGQFRQFLCPPPVRNTTSLNEGP